MKQAEALKKKDRKIYQYEPQEKEQMHLWFERMDRAWEDMNAALEEFDGLSLIQTLQSNRLARNSFLTPVANDGEVRVVTGTTEGKADSVFNAVLNQNIDIEITAFNEFDISDVLLGDSLTKIVRRTGQMENEEDIEAAVLDELITAPSVFIQETNTDEWYYDRLLTEGQWSDLWQFKIPTFEKQGWYRKRQPKKVLWTCDQVFLADMRIPAYLFNTQPYILTYRTRTHEDAQRVYQHSPRWGFVNPGMPQKQEMRGNVSSSEWRFSRKLQANEVEEVIGKSVCDDTMQIWLNGVPMLPVGCPYLGNRFGTYDMTMEIPKEIHRKFAHGRPIVSQTKTLQALKDEDFRLVILERRQQIFQPIVTKAEVILSRDMFLPSAITYGITKDEVQSLVDRSGVVNNSMQEMIEKEIESFINVSSLFQGLESGGDITAYQAAQQMKQALIMLGHLLTARMRAKRNCTYLRLYNILQNLLDPIDTRFNGYLKKSEDIYRTYSLFDADLHDGAVGTELISFIDRQLLPQEKNEVIAREKKSRAERHPVAYTFLPVEKLKRGVFLFRVSTIFSEKRNSLIEKEMFKKDIIDSIDLGNAVGIPMNPSYITQEWGKRVKMDPSKLYILPQAPVLNGGGMVPQRMGQKGRGGQNPGVRETIEAGAGSMPR